MIGWIQNIIRIFRVPNLGIGIIILFSILFVLYRRNILELIYNKNTWAVSALIFCFTMISGHMWNKMNKAKFYDTMEVLISRAARKQIVVESYIIAVLNATIVFGMILSIEGAGGVSRTVASGTQRARKRQKLLQVAGLVLMFASFAMLLTVFRMKRPWYNFGF